ncbi:MAG: type III-B CRISPR-associated protein Cas10/Cmr2 [Xenococcaceae cyanobacterium]
MSVQTLRSLYALLPNPNQYKCLQCWGGEETFNQIKQWWENQGGLPKDIASSSDRVNLEYENLSSQDAIKIKHPISGQQQQIEIASNTKKIVIPPGIQNETDAKKVFWWFWRFFPELSVQQASQALLEPAHHILPDCPIYSYRSTVSALVGTMYPDVEAEQKKHPYLLLFTFSPVQEFIKASRKFLDFWAGSYLLHYLSAKLCWFIANLQGPDTIITPSLWGQEIIDALLLKEYDNFDEYFQEISRDANYPDGLTPVTRFDKKVSTSLVTAGFPNIITVLTSGKEAAEKLGEDLSQKLRQEWHSIALKVREDIKNRFLHQDFDKLWQGISPKNEFSPASREELKTWQGQHGVWEWNKLWAAQIEHSWEPYWVAVPLGNPDDELKIKEDSDYNFNGDWMAAQETVAQTRAKTPPPTEAEKTIYKTLNVGTWWGSIQARLGQAVQALKNTRIWQIPAAPGSRSTISGQFSAVHPRLHYTGQFREGAGIPAESMRLFWRAMAEVYPGLFNGSEQLNAIELTKRMAWAYGGVAQSLTGDKEGAASSGDQLEATTTLSQEVVEELALPSDSITDIDYNQLIRFPNLSSIAAARFAHDDWLNGKGKIRQYWHNLAKYVRKKLGEKERCRFASRTRARPFHLRKTDLQINPNGEGRRNYNGVMFSSKWLADDMGLERTETNTLRSLVEEAHKDCDFGEGSPADWWVIVLGDGDGMGQYVSGKKLHPYEKYLIETDPNQFITGDRYPQLSQEEYEAKKREFIEQFQGREEIGREGEGEIGREGEGCSTEETRPLLKTRKRMGPATHVGLNRALLDFSNRIVPYLTERRFCGRVIYSGGDDVMAVLPLEDLPEYLLSLRAAWCGKADPYLQDSDVPDVRFKAQEGYWQPQGDNLYGLPNRPLFTMGEGATMSLGIVIAYKSVPLPTVLNALWEAEAERAKKMQGVWAKKDCHCQRQPEIPPKDGLCFRVLYGSGNCLEALMKGHLLHQWWQFVNTSQRAELSPLLYRLAEELPRHAAITQDDQLVAKAAEAIANRRDNQKKINTLPHLIEWLKQWEAWASQVETAWQKQQQKNPGSGKQVVIFALSLLIQSGLYQLASLLLQDYQNPQEPRPLGITLEELAKLLRFTAFWLDKMEQRAAWLESPNQEKEV